MDTIDTNEIRFTMRMDSNLYERIKETAKKSKRSIAKEIEFQLEQNLQNDVSPSDLKFLLDKCSDILQDHDYELRRMYDLIEKVVEHLK